MTPRDPQDTSKKSKTSKKKDVTPSPLKKKISELSKADIEAMEVLLGTPDMPFPMWGTQKIEHEGVSELGQALSVIAEDENPLVVLSEKSFDEAWGIIARELPTPSMLPIFREMLERMAPDSKNRQFFVMGDPGMGKSFMGGMIGRVMSNEAPRVYDCGGKQMNSMLFEMVLDFGAGDGLAEQIEKTMSEGKLKNASILVLKNMANTVNDSNNKYINELSEGIFEIDWEALSKESKIGAKIKAVMEGFNDIAKLEGFDKGGANMLGMNSQFGPMITDFIEGNFATYDEYNKSKQGGDDALQTVLQFINGEIDECTVENPLKGKDGVSGPTHFTFRREDVKAGWGILFTGNKGKDGATTRALNKSVYSRLGPRDLPEVSEMDWQHRICQLMTGVPISTWYNVYKKDADQNPEAFAEFLWHIRTSGLSEEKVKTIPENQKIWIQNWQRVVSATEKLGSFFHGWRDMMDVEKAAYVYGLGDEVDDDFAAEQALDFRRAIKVLQKAAKPRAKLKPAGFAAKIPSKSDLKRKPKRNADAAQTENLEMEYGTRLTEIIVNDIFESSGAMQKDELYKKLKELAEKCAIIEQEFNGDGERSQVKTVEQELNISRFDSADIRVQAKIAQEIFCKMLRDQHPEIDASDDEIVTIDRLTGIIEEMRSTALDARETNKMSVPNNDTGSLMDTPFVDVFMHDRAAQNKDKDEPYFDDVLTHEEFLQAFVLPGLKDKNINAIWDSNVTIFMKTDKYNENVKKAEAEISEQQSKLKDTDETLKTKQSELEAFNKAADPKADDIAKLEDEIKKLETAKTDIHEMISNLEESRDENKKIVENIKEKGLDALKELEKDAANKDLDLEDEAESLRVAENRSKSGIGFTTVFCRVEDDGEVDENTPLEYSAVHILRHEKTDKTLIIGDKISDSLKEAFKKAKVRYVDYSQEDAANKINTAVTEMTRSMGDDAMSTLSGAFTYRNTPDAKELSKTDLGSKIVASKKVVQSLDGSDQTKSMLKVFYKPYAA